MDPVSGNIPQRPVDQPLPLKPRHSGKGGAFDLYAKMRFPAAIIAAVAGMAGAVIDHYKAAWGEGGAKNLFDFVCNR